MPLFEVILIALGLAMDCFAVSLGIGTSGRANSLRSIFRIAFHFGLFQALMPVIGWFAGSRIANLIGGFDHWVAFALLAFVGIRMIRSGLSKDGTQSGGDPSRGRTLIMLSIATSIDALAIGLSLALLKVGILMPVVIIGLVSASLSVLGLRIGTRLGKTFGKGMEVLGGLVLIGIGLRILIVHLL